MIFPILSQYLPVEILSSQYSGINIYLLAVSSFPRGEGFYFSILKLLGVLVVFLLWVRTCWWMDQDARDLGLPLEFWNPLLFASGALGLFLIWLLPWFLVSWPIFLILYLTPTFIFVGIRNRKVPLEQKVLTERHLKLMAQKYLKLNLGLEEEKSEDTGPPLRFIGKSYHETQEDPNRVVRAAGSKGYKAALEMVYEAIELRATDIHMEPSRNQMAVRFRIDGILQTTDPFNRHMGEAVINIFKVLADMDIVEKRKPQDGSFSAKAQDRTVDFRVATAGSVAGEKLVMRLFDRGQQIMDLAQIGMRDRMHEQVYNIVTQPHGMLVVCGPTGAGKSTTLYSSLNEIDRFQKNVLTIENPVECQVPNVTQIEVNLKAGKTFASELRSVLRQDPDVIMVGEVRDAETAETACQAAQTGHMVFTTLHANDSVTAIIRLLDLGVQPATLSSAISAVLSQRLVRVLCPKCKVRYKPNPEMLRKANLPMEKIKFFFRPPDPGERKQLHQATGEPENCQHCGGTGYRGRTGIFELLVINDPIRELIRENPNLNAIKQEAVKSGMKYLQEDGLRQVIQGRTSIQELLRVCK
ncbi:MAG TPA: GspE/PulE family protein [Gemmataceae bacterium]|nr:GspE/PulE family protein [Gemmataceae bacterium]